MFKNNYIKHQPLFLLFLDHQTSIRYFPIQKQFSKVKLSKFFNL